MSSSLKRVGMMVALVLMAVQAHTAEAYGRRNNRLQSTSCPVNLHQLMFNQSGYIQYTQYNTPMPALPAFTMHYWVMFLDLNRNSTIFHYAVDRNMTNNQDRPTARSNNDLTVQLEVATLNGHGLEHYWTVRVNDVWVCRVASPPLTLNTWHHVGLSWRSADGLWSVFMNGRLLDTGYSRESAGMVVPAGGLAVSGQHQSTVDEFMDQGEGLEGWLTLFHLSSTHLASPRSSFTAATISSLTRMCTTDFQTDVINWRTTQRKGYGGINEALAREVCGDF